MNGPAGDRRYGPKRAGYVYFIAPEALLHRRDDCAVVKIGYTSTSPTERLRSLQTGSPLPLKVWAYVEGGQDLEAAFHSTFAELRVHGEWFMAFNRLYDFLGYLAQEPNTGKLIPFADLQAAVLDNIFTGDPRPGCDPQLWALSARPEHLADYFPDAWREVLLWA